MFWKHIMQRTAAKMHAAVAIALTGLLLAAFLAPAKTGRLHGTVLDAHTGSPLAGVNVEILNTTLKTTTDQNGRYEFTAVPVGKHDVTFTLFGYLHRTFRNVTIEERGAKLLDATLITSPVQDETAVARMMEKYSGADGRFYAPTFAAAPRSRYNIEDYAHIVENTWQNPLSNPLSTFSIDVDAASYGNIRRFIEHGQTPPKDAVRIEEMVNYFTYEYPDPSGEHPFSITMEAGTAPWAPQHRLVHIGLQGKRMAETERPASNLVFLIDVSGSMDSPDKLPLLKQAFGLLIDELRFEDRVAIVVYAGAAGLVLPSTSGSQKQKIRDALSMLEAGGSTAGAAGIRLAYEVAQQNHLYGGNNRVILATDGDFNVGVSSDAELIRLIEEKRNQGTYLTVLGFGTGNLKDNKMEQIADHGNGNYYYIDSRLEAEKVLVREMGSTLFTIAKDVKFQVEFNPARVAAYRLVGYENRVLDAEDFEDDTKDAGELGAGHSVTALYEIVPVGVESDVLARVAPDLRYQTPRNVTGTSTSELLFVKLRYKKPWVDSSQLIEQPLFDTGEDSVSPDYLFAAAVASFGMILRDSQYKGDTSLEQVLKLARDGLGSDREGYRNAFIDLVKNYWQITEGHTPPPISHSMD